MGSSLIIFKDYSKAKGWVIRSYPNSYKYSTPMYDIDISIKILFTRDMFVYMWGVRVCFMAYLILERIQGALNVLAHITKSGRHRQEYPFPFYIILKVILSKSVNILNWSLNEKAASLIF